jgi:hypothetical protein
MRPKRTFQRMAWRFIAFLSENDQKNGKIIGLDPPINLVSWYHKIKKWRYSSATLKYSEWNGTDCHFSDYFQELDFESAEVETIYLTTKFFLALDVKWDNCTTNMASSSLHKSIMFIQKNWTKNLKWHGWYHIPIL